MDQVKIGKFLSDERKAKGYTQKQLSELLGISDKTISKWECCSNHIDRAWQQQVAFQNMNLSI